MKKYIPFLLLLLTQGCIFQEDDDFQPDPTLPPIEQLPPITSEGAHTFGCLINGEVWVSDNDHRFGSGSQLGVSPDFPEGVVSITGKRQVNDDIRESLRLVAFPVFDIGIYDQYREEQVLSKWGTGCEYSLDTLKDNFIRINHIDLEKRTYSGEFELVLYLEKGECTDDTLIITEGRFDVEY